VEGQISDIGSELRETRLRLGLTLEQVETATRIRPRYLEALEEERFDELPGEAYAKGFLRTYADHLGLDGQQFLARYRERFPRRPEPPVSPAPQPPYEARRLRAAAVGLGAVAVLAVGGLVAWQLEDHDGRTDTVSSSTPAASAEARTVSKKAAPAPARTPVLTLRAVANCWLQIRVGGPSGRRAWIGTLRPGRRLRFGLGKPLWIVAGNPRALRATVGGRRRALPADAPRMVVTQRAIRRA
jgi:transcriptional regulator with XRE-family HTH domain